VLASLDVCDVLADCDCNAEALDCKIPRFMPYCVRATSIAEQAVMRTIATQIKSWQQHWSACSTGLARCQQVVHLLMAFLSFLAALSAQRLGMHGCILKRCWTSNSDNCSVDRASCCSRRSGRQSCELDYNTYRLPTQK
jgi:hypothetical protein